MRDILGVKINQNRNIFLIMVAWRIKFITPDSLQQSSPATLPLWCKSAKSYLNLHVFVCFFSLCDMAYEEHTGDEVCLLYHIRFAICAFEPPSFSRINNSASRLIYREITVTVLQPSELNFRKLSTGGMQTCRLAIVVPKVAKTVLPNSVLIQTLFCVNLFRNTPETQTKADYLTKVVFTLCKEVRSRWLKLRPG